MATDYAPVNLVKVGKEADKEIPGCKFSGVLGDSKHKYGYHRGRNVLPSSDYSVRLTLDKGGASGAASALDLSFTAAQMKVVTARLRKSALDPHDPRMEPVREFYGTLNGRTVFGLTKTGLATPWSSSSSDSSHLWHIHISFFRKFSNDYKRLRGVIDVMKGIPWKRPVVKTPVAVTPKPKPPVVTPPKPATPKPTQHKVMKGDTVIKVSKKYGVPVDALRRLNNLPPSDIIRVGSILRLADAVSPAPAKPAPVVPPKETPAVGGPGAPEDPSEKHRPIWGVRFRKYYVGANGERDWTTVANTLLEIDARLKRIEDKLNEGGTDEGSNAPTA